MRIQAPTLLAMGLTVLLWVSAGPTVAGADTGFQDRIDDQADEVLVSRQTVGYRKGRRLTFRVVTLGWAEVEVSTARAFLAMHAAAATAGIELFIRSGFRSHEHQEWLYQAWRAGFGNRAARPGHSNHQSGRALDLYLGDPGTLAWLEENARRFGFKRTVRGEPWHWEYVKRARRGKRAATAARARGRRR